MLKRTITGAFITLLIYITIYFSYIPIVLKIATAFLSAFSVYEIFATVNPKFSGRLLPHAAALFGIAISFVRLQYYSKALIIIFPVVVAFFVYLMCHIDKEKRFDDKRALPLALSVVILFRAIPELRGVENGLWYLTFAVTLTLVCDIAAYLVGRAFGKHKLIPKVSPKKTIEGSVGGVLLSAAVMLAGAKALEHFTGISVNYVVLFVHSLMASVVAQLGDLSMSSIKRIDGVKDFGKLFPGHGGILDRFDSHLFVIPFTLIFYRVTGGFFL